MKRLLWLLSLLAASPAFAQENGIEQTSDVLVVPAGDKFLRWYAHLGRSYFVQISDVNEPLVKWAWAPLIEAGNDAEISYEVDGTPAKGFFRLKYTDQIPGSGETLESADFDGDALSNWMELTVTHTNPLNRDTDFDGLSDLFEWNNGMDPNDNGIDPNDNGEIDSNNGAAGDPDGDGFSNAEEEIGHTNPNSAADFPPHILQENRGMIEHWQIFDYRDPDSPGPVPPPGRRETLSQENNGSAFSSTDVIAPALGPSGVRALLISEMPEQPSEDALRWALDVSYIEADSRSYYEYHVPYQAEPLVAQVDNTITNVTHSRMWEKRPASLSQDGPSVSTYLLVTRSYEVGGTILTYEAKNFTTSQNQTQSAAVDFIPVATESDVEVKRDLLIPILRDYKDPVDPYDDVRIIPLSPAQVNPVAANIAWIEPHSSATVATPRMPQLEFSIPSLPEETTLQVKLEVQYTRGNGEREERNQPQDLIRIPADGSFQTIPGNTWEIWRAYQTEPFFGGEATLTYKLLNGQTTALAAQTIRFRIGGKNPTPARAKAYIESLTNAGPQGSLWFAYAIAKTESKDYNGPTTRYNHFWELPKGPNDNNYRVSRTRHVGRPVWGEDDGEDENGDPLPGGYGMFQVTGTAAISTANISRQEIWNWQENARAGLTILERKRIVADNWMTQQKNVNNANGVALQSLAVRSVTFAEGTSRTMNHAVAMKAWNGASRPPSSFTDPDPAPAGFIIDPQGSGHFCYWKSSASGTNKWALNRYNAVNPTFNYVDRVCQEVE